MQSSEEESSANIDDQASTNKSSKGLSDVGILNDAKLNQEVSIFQSMSFINSNYNSAFFQVIKLRNVAKKSKGKIIQSMIRKARKLQKATENNPKNLKKAENLLEVVNELKVFYCWLGAPQCIKIMFEFFRICLLTQ